ncbi:MAG: phasin family protein [Alphaproteobacteria bacterium]
MSKPFNPFAELDFSKFMAELKIPGVDFDQVASTYRKNLEAMTTASQVAVEGAQSVVKRQAELLRESMEEYAQLMRQYSTPASAEEAASKHADAAKRTFEATLAHMREISEMIAKTNQDSLEIINKRVSELLDEVKAMATKKKVKSAA